LGATSQSALAQMAPFSLVEQEEGEVRLWVYTPLGGV